ncbi:putative transposase [Candidatus Erwinia dacicola]|uniref:Transposase n=1 Tax=Candidatus Erwinia dacicola TaxID=252393 RepID=A0A328TSR8_9GAMM|nr:putative transposase [Candidatus Erwinia dacicola]
MTGKIFTQRIERNTLTLRTRIKRLARKTICFSRSIEVHEKVIGSFIEKHSERTVFNRCHFSNRAERVTVAVSKN